MEAIEAIKADVTCSAKYEMGIKTQKQLNSDEISKPVLALFSHKKD